MIDGDASAGIAPPSSPSGPVVLLSNAERNRGDDASSSSSAREVGEERERESNQRIIALSRGEEWRH
jgi:hypothetical protein